MRIPTEHFSHVPVVALSPTMVSPVQTDCSMASAILSRLNGLDGDRGSVGSAPTSPKLSRMSLSPIQGAKIMSSSYHDSSSSEPQSLYNISPAHSISEKRYLNLLLCKDVMAKLNFVLILLISFSGTLRIGLLLKVLLLLIGNIS